MIERVFADLERALRAHRPDDAGRIVRELEVWRSLSGRWHTARFEPGGPLPVPVSPGPCMETVREATFAFLPDRAAAITGSVARTLWPTALRSQGGDFFEPFRRDEAVVAEPDRLPSLVVLGPADKARDQLRIVLEPAAIPTELGLQPIIIPLQFQLTEGRVALVPSREATAHVNGVPATKAPLSDCDVITGKHLPSLLFLERIGA